MVNSPNPIEFRDLGIGDAGWLIQRHAELYAEEEGFDASFEPLVAEILADYMRNHDPKRERAWIATKEGQRIGSIFCVKSDEPDTAKLRLFFIEPEARGLGLGHRLLTECLGYAKSKGYHTMRLWTHESHEAACALYQKHGFHCVSSTSVHNFGTDLVEQIWERAL